MLKEIWVYLEAETERTGIKKGSLEILTHARKMADTSGHSVTAVIISEKVDLVADTAVNHGANKLYIIPGDKSLLHDQDYQVNLLCSLIQESKPALLLFSATPLGKTIAPRLAARLNSGLMSDCVELKLENDEIIGRRSIMHGKAHAVIACNISAFCIATICTGAFDIKKSTHTGNPEIVRLAGSCSEKSRVQFLEHIQGDPATINLKEADTIIGIGRGLENAGNMSMVEELAGLLGASIGATRTAVDLKWLPLERQIGITGENVSPLLFISCGISGQYPHTVGMDASEIIIAINKDRDAPIFKLADLGVLGDMAKIIPALSKQIKNAIDQKGQP
jgi:electron transfer flavoprotein alpha subunit